MSVMPSGEVLVPENGMDKKTKAKGQKVSFG